MKLLSRYITTTVLGTIFIILFILMGLELLISFIGQLSDIGTGDYNLLQATRFIIFDMPYQLYNFFPMAGLIGCLIGLGTLANQSELIVMRAAGFSTGQITFTVLKAACVMVLIAMILGEVVAPYSEHAANLGKTIAKSGAQAVNTEQGLWIREDKEFIHINSVVNKHQLQNINTYEFNNNHQLIVTMSAKNAYYHHDAWVLQDVQQTRIDRDKVSSKEFTTYPWNLSINPNLLTSSNGNPRDMSLIQLRTNISYLSRNGLQASLYELNFWKRVFQPFATAVMIFLAIPFVFGSMRSVPMGVRILTGVSIGFTFYLLNEFFGPLSLLYQIPPLLGAILPTLIFVVLGSWLLVRMR